MNSYKYSVNHHIQLKISLSWPRMCEEDECNHDNRLIKYKPEAKCSFLMLTAVKIT